VFLLFYELSSETFGMHCVVTKHKKDVNPIAQLSRCTP